jgi:hypothetical protein
LSSQNMAPGNGIVSVTASGSSLSLTVTMATTGGAYFSFSSVVLRASP